MNRDRSLSRENNSTSMRNNLMGSTTPMMNSNKYNIMNSTNGKGKGKGQGNQSKMNTTRSNTNTNVAQDIGRITFADSVFPNAKF